MQPRGGGLFEIFVPEARPGMRYRYQLPDDRARPDPVSRLQEGSVHGPSTLFDPAFAWTDQSWRGLELEDLVFYELHVGTFTPEGTLDAIIPRLGDLAELGVNAIELMPLAAFDGPRGWGYDGVLLYTVHAPYGGPRALQRLIDACHSRGLAVFLDVVYNHLGPSGNYLSELGPYFTTRHVTPWGEAINYDGPDSGPVRRFMIDNALSWVNDFHIDGLRLDAIHGIVDESPRHVLQELNDEVQALAARLGRRVQVIAESDLNDPRVIRPKEEGGWGLAAQWSDDFHHALHSLVTGERVGYYADFGKFEDLAKAYAEGFVLSGQRSVYRGRPHGRSAQGLPHKRFVIAAQNHDQIGNRPQGDRLAASLPPEALRMVAAATLLSPCLPLVFMGEEWAETAPFQYFTSFPDRALGKAVFEGRRGDEQRFGWNEEVPDPQALKTFERSKVDWSSAKLEPHASMRRFYRALLEIRRNRAAHGGARLEELEVSCDAVRRILWLQWLSPGRSRALLVLHFASETGRGALTLPEGSWRVLLDSWLPELAGPSEWALPSGELSGAINLGPWHAALLLKT
jgi:maltooligosyltrehalose trehalohydrolase